MKNNKRRRDIKSKLIAAICMLMVSTIMMVSTTYAWFTLSTAPEVTGINTSVGANGNLEMALLSGDGDTKAIQSAVGDSMASNEVTEANITWGNLVDLSDTSYGLSGITLMPAALNASVNGDGNAVIVMGTDGAPQNNVHLKTPNYGFDGRVTDVSPSTMANAADAAGKFYAPSADNVSYGVRGIGTASAMTQRQLDYRNYRATGSSAASNAAGTAETALATNGQVLASIVITHATATADSEVYYQADLDALSALEDALNGDAGALKDIENALKAYVLAAIASAESGLDDTVAEAAVATLKDKTLAEVVAYNADGVDMASILVGINGWDTLYTKFTGMVGNMDAARELIDGATASGTAEVDGETVNTYTWATISPILLKFADPDYMVVNDMTAAEIKADMNAFVTATTEKGMKIDVEVPTRSGIFADIADFCGDYDVPITLKGIKYGSIGPVDMPATMYATTTLPATYLNALGTAVQGMGAPEATTSADTLISDMYGFVIDLAFRTNAANANLLLQTEGVDRIYSENTDTTTDTFGGGSTMTFQGTTGFGTDKVQDLMENINILFYNTTTGEVYAAAKLDADNVTTEAALNKVTAPLVIKDYTYNADTSSFTFGDAAIDGTLMALAQNTAHTISVLVYLDGTTITNADVANAATSMTGEINLQFSTDATLDPMDYTPYMNQGSTTETSSEAAGG